MQSNLNLLYLIYRLFLCFSQYNALSDIYKVHSKMQLHKFLGKNAFYRIHNVFDMYCIENSDSIIIKNLSPKST